MMPGALPLRQARRRLDAPRMARIDSMGRSVHNFDFSTGSITADSTAPPLRRPTGDTNHEEVTRSNSSRLADDTAFSQDTAKQSNSDVNKPGEGSRYSRVQWLWQWIKVGSPVPSGLSRDMRDWLQSGVARPALVLLCLGLAVQRGMLWLLASAPEELVSKPRLVFALDALNVVVGWAFANSVLAGTGSYASKPRKLARVLFNVESLAATLNAALSAAVTVSDGHGGRLSDRGRLRGSLFKHDEDSAMHTNTESTRSKAMDFDDADRVSAIGGLARCTDLLKLCGIEAFNLFDRLDAWGAADALAEAGKLRSASEPSSDGAALRQKLLDVHQDTSLGALLTAFEREVFLLERRCIITGSDARLVLDSKASLTGAVEEALISTKVHEPRLVQFHIDVMLLLWVWVWLPFSLAVSLGRFALIFFPFIAFILSGFRMYGRWLGDPFDVPSKFPRMNYLRWLADFCDKIDGLAVLDERLTLVC